VVRVQTNIHYRSLVLSRLFNVAQASMEAKGTPPSVRYLWHAGGHGASWEHPSMFTSLCHFFQAHV
jgi:hypothetical protein